MKLRTTDGLTHVGYAKQRLTVLEGAIRDYMGLLFMSIPYRFSSFSPLPLLEMAGNLLI